MDEAIMSKVYIQTDAQGRVTRCEGGYTMSAIEDLSEWVCIDEGTGDRYNLCQSQYFDGGLYTGDGFCRYVYEDDACRLRADAEIEADREEERERRWRAARFFEPGECMTVDGSLYKAVLPILAGTRITVGTNVVETTIEAEISSYYEEGSA